jgi:hypothetical protein
MSEKVLSKEQLLQEFVAAYERLLETALRTTERDTSLPGDTWGAREVVAHLAGWEVMAVSSMNLHSPLPFC